MSEKVIYNCHNHIFSHENVPNRYFPLYSVPATRIRPIRWTLRLILKGVIPWSKKDKVHRYAAFINALYRKTQEGNLKPLIGYYPKGTKFIILPMDMRYMHAGNVKQDIDEQHEILADLATKAEYKNILLPFAHIDPRRTDALNRLRKLVEKFNFRGVKIYPTLGYSPDNPRLMDEIYPYMIEQNIPLLAHCSKGSVNSKEMKKEEAHALADPDNYVSVLEKFPELRICLGHFGGIDEWRRHINDPRDEANPTWLTKIRELIESKKYPNLFTDISYTIFNFHENVPLLKILLENDDILKKVLFGSDFYMVESEKYSEKRLSLDLRYALGEEKFWRIANINPRIYLGELKVES